MSVSTADELTMDIEQQSLQSILTRRCGVLRKNETVRTSLLEGLGDFKR
jgi:hypothetical protein